jgi:glycerophosphoryl diester phosphodiesterase
MNCINRVFIDTQDNPRGRFIIQEGISVMPEDRLQKPTWISHRGYTANAVENTYAAFKAAVDIGFTFLETDLRITKDNHIALIHDHRLKRLANDSRCVSDLNRREIESLRLANGEPFLFFEQFIESFGNCFWTLDIKPENGEQTIQVLALWVENNNFFHPFIKQVKFLTWKPEHEKLLNACFPGADCYARKKECWRAGLAVLFGLPALGGIKPNRTYALTASLGNISLFKKTIVSRFHKRSARTIAFLPSSDELAKKALEANFDEILTNGKIL